MTDPTYWKKCSTCKKEMTFLGMYYVCSVSTCKHARKGFRFCSVECWGAHLGFMNHRQAWAEDAKAPSLKEYLAEMNDEPTDREPVRHIIKPQTVGESGGQVIKSDDALIVVSKVKALIKSASDMSTSQCAIEALTAKVCSELTKAIENAKIAGRKTVMGRDVK